MNRREALTHLAAAPLGLAAFTVPGPTRERAATAPIEFPACCPRAKFVDITRHSDLPARVYLCANCSQRVWAAGLDEDGMEDRP